MKRAQRLTAGTSQCDRAGFVLRRAVLSDVPGILTAHHHSVCGLAAKDYSKEQVAAWTARILARDAAEHIAYQIKHESVWVAACDGVVEGFAHFRAPEDVHPAAYLHALYLTPKVAGKGLGRQLVALIEAEARRLGYTRIGLHSSRTAHGFYQKLGYVDAGTELLHWAEGVGLPSQPMAKDMVDT